jgi:hypothetical protein
LFTGYLCYSSYLSVYFIQFVNQFVSLQNSEYGERKKLEYLGRKGMGYLVDSMDPKAKEEHEEEHEDSKEGKKIQNN